jgi:Carboxypeptidase regulatory-like domain
MRLSMKYILFAASLFFPISTIDAYSCDCGGFRPPCEEYGRASAVFIGVVIGDSSIDSQDGEYQFQKRSVSFAVEETFHGLRGTSAEVITGMGGGDCGVGFKRGERYLVYAYTNPQDNKLHTSICNRTRALSQAGEDLQYLRGLSAAPGVRIYGEVQRYWSGANEGREPESIAGIKVSIDGTKKRVEMMTDLKGRFSADGLPGGVYKVKISLPQGLMSHTPEQEIKVADGGCATIPFSVVSDGRLSGRVLDFNGHPMPDAEISLCHPEEKMYGFKLYIAYSDKDGLYEFKAIPPGRYALGAWFDGLNIQNRPVQRIYHPGVENIAQATIVTIDDGGKVEMNDLVLPPPRTERSVEGVVEWSDGKPAPNAGIEYVPVNVPAGYGAKSDQEGRFSFKVHDGLKIKIRARGEIKWGKYIYSDWVETTVMDEDVKVKIVLPANQ